MNVEVNFLAVALAALSSMLVGWVWYSRPVFGDRWAKLVKLSDKQMKEGAPRAMLLTFAASLVTAYVLAHVAYLSHYFYDNSFLQDSLMTAFWVWLGFTATRLITHDLFEQRNSTLTLLNISHELVTLLAMGLVIGLVGHGDPNA